MHTGPNSAPRVLFLLLCVIFYAGSIFIVFGPIFCTTLHDAAWRLLFFASITNMWTFPPPPLNNVEEYNKISEMMKNYVLIIVTICTYVYSVLAYYCKIVSYVNVNILCELANMVPTIPMYFQSIYATLLRGGGGNVDNR